MLVLAAVLVGCAGPGADVTGVGPSPSTSPSTTTTSPAPAAPAPTTSAGVAPPAANASSTADTAPTPANPSTGTETAAPTTQTWSESATTTTSAETSSTGSASQTGTYGPPAPEPEPEADLLVLHASDLGPGWVDDDPHPAPGTRMNQTDSAKTSLARSTGAGSPWLVETTVRVFRTPAEALAEFESAREDAPRSEVQDVAAGDHAFVWVQSPGSWEAGWAVEGRVVWSLDLAGDGGSMSPSTASLLQTVAAKQ